MNKYYEQITGLRGLFCVAIVIYHLLFHYRGIEASGFIPNIAIVWGGFFVISGYFLHYEYAKKFWFGKINNILIPFVLSVTIIFIFRIIFEKGYSASVITLFLNYLVFPNLIGVEFVDGAHWFVEKLIYFYVVFWIINLIGKEKWRILLYAYTIGCFVSLFLISNNSTLAKLIMVIFDSRFLFLILGINLSEHNKEKTEKNVVIIINFLMICLWFVIYSHWSNCLYFIVILFIIKMSLLEKISFFNNRLLLLLGSSSYFIYLLHQQIGYIIIGIFNDDLLGYIFAITFVLAVSITISKVYKHILKLFKVQKRV